MNINDRQKAFLSKRARLVKAWSVAGPLLIFGVIVFIVWLFYYAPLFINPFEALSRVEAGSLEDTTLLVAAVLLPMMSLLCVFLVVTLIAFIYAAIAIEKKYIQALSQLLDAER